MANLNNTAYYFLSTNAQVWAALVAFGGIAIRDRMTQASRSMDETFQILVELLDPMRSDLSNTVPGHRSDVFRSRENLAAVLDHPENTLQGLLKYTGAPNVVYPHPFEGRGVYLSDLLSEALDRYEGYKSQRILLTELLPKHLAILLGGGLSMILVSLILIGPVEWLGNSLPFVIPSFLIIMAFNCNLMWQLFPAFGIEELVKKVLKKELWGQ